MCILGSNFLLYWNITVEDQQGTKYAKDANLNQEQNQQKIITFHKVIFCYICLNILLLLLIRENTQIIDQNPNHDLWITLENVLIKPKLNYSIVLT